MFEDISQILNINPNLLLVLLAWSLVWKGIALWKAAKKTQLAWFIALLIVNTFGILEILYIFVFSKIKLKGKKSSPKKKPVKVKKRKLKGGKK